MASSLSTDAQLITTLTCNDVILGRGQGPSQSVGNQQFLKIIRKHKREYQSTNNRKGKERIAREVVDHIRDTLNGRFVKEIQNKKSNVRVWHEVTYAIALEKTKQALRDHKNEDRVGPCEEKNNEETKDYKHSEEEAASRNSDKAAEEQKIEAIHVTEENAPAPQSLLPNPAIPLSASSTAVPAPDLAFSSLRNAQHLPPLPISSLRFPGAAYRDPTLLQGAVLANQGFHPALLQQQHGALFRDVPAVPLAFSSLHTTPCPSLSTPANAQVAYRPPQPLEDIRILAGALVQQVENVYDHFSERERQSMTERARTHQFNEYGHRSGAAAPIRQTERLSEARSVRNRAQTVQTQSREMDASDRYEFTERYSQRDSTKNETERESVLPSSDGKSDHATFKNEPDSEKDTETSDIEQIQKFLRAAHEDEPDAPTITPEQEAKERECMTKEEQDATLADLFGDLCEITPSVKRVKRPATQPQCTETLIDDIRSELMRLPAEEKPALLEALAKCQSKEFSDHRMELFLRAEGMNPKAAARRFALYWEKRRKWFGADKFCLPMTRNGALREEHAIIQSGLMSLLPDLDASGRQILYVTVRLNTYDGYTSDSFVAAEHPSARNGIIILMCHRAASIRNYPPKVKLMMELIELQREVWPVKSVATHNCHMTSFMRKYFRPIMVALMDKHLRTRQLFHDVPDAEIPRALAKYGIPEEVLPVEMGGKSTYSHWKWLMNRQQYESE